MSNVDRTKIRYGTRRQTPGNAATHAVMEAAAFYGVPCYRMQSRTFTVKGAGGRERPMFAGGWHDHWGIFHAKGMPDLLLTPRIRIQVYYGNGALVHAVPKFECVPLWCEVKAGRDKLSEDQIAFRDDVIEAGAFWICCQDSCDELLAWFKTHAVERMCVDLALRKKPQASETRLSQSHHAPARVVLREKMD